MGTDYGNLVRLRNNVYIVRTQAGFRKALKHFNDEMPLYRSGYPKSYPSLVFFSLEYAGYIKLVATCIPLCDLEAALLVENNRKHSVNTTSKETNMENKPDSFVCQEPGTPVYNWHASNVSIPGTAENWDNRVLGSDEAFVNVASPEVNSAVDAALGLVTVKLRMGKADVDKLEALAKEKGLILQAYIKSVLAKEISKT